MLRKSSQVGVVVDMDTRRIAKGYRISHWAQAMRERVASGISIKAFCQDKGISQNTYYYWQRKLREAACQEMVAVSESRNAKAVVPIGWAVCQPEETATAKTLAIEIGGYRVNVEPDTDQELLAKTCRMLKSLC
jgi:putative transposase